jgi:hypothetical protein
MLKAKYASTVLRHKAQGVGCVDKSNSLEIIKVKEEKP